MTDSIHQKLNRVRKPRVHITYEVETNGAEVKRELPFVVGVMGDYSGDNSEKKKSLKERKFVQVDRDNVNDIMRNIAPTLQLNVDNTLVNDDSQMSVNLAFNSMKDFEPESIVNQVEPLKRLLEARNKLRELMSKADRSEELESILEEVLSNSDQLNQLSESLGVQPTGSSTTSAPATATEESE